MKMLDTKLDLLLVHNISLTSVTVRLVALSRPLYLLLGQANRDRYD